MARVSTCTAGTTGGPGSGLERGACYLLKETTPEVAYATFEDLVRDGEPGLVVTRQFPDRVKREHNITNARVIWLSHTPGEDFHNPTAIGTLAKVIQKFIEDSNGLGVVLLDGLEYLIINNGFPETLMFVERMNEFVMQRRAIVLIPISPKTLEGKELTLLERNLLRLDHGASGMALGQEVHGMPPVVRIIPRDAHLLADCSWIVRFLGSVPTDVDISSVPLEAKVRKAQRAGVPFLIFVSGGEVRTLIFDAVLWSGRQETMAAESFLKEVKTWMRGAGSRPSGEDPEVVQLRNEVRRVREQAERLARTSHDLRSETSAAGRPDLARDARSTPLKAHDPIRQTPDGDTQLMTAKVCLVGGKSSGKTALIRRFALDKFDDKYIQTLGTRVSRKEVVVRNREAGNFRVNMTIWDIMGQKGFRELLKEAFFYGAQGLIAVCNSRRRATLLDAVDWVESVRETVGPIPVVFAANDPGRNGYERLKEDELRQTAAGFGAPYFFTASRTGKNVEAMFQSIADLIVEARFRQ